MITLACPHGLRITDDSEPRSPKYQTEWLRALLLACPACEHDAYPLIMVEGRDVPPEPASSDQPKPEQAAEREDEDEPEPIDLDEIDAELDAEEEPPAPVAEKPRRMLERHGRDGLTPIATRILEYIRDHEEAHPGEIRSEFAVTRRTWEGARDVLLERGLVVAEGTRAGRVFRPAPSQTEHRRQIEAGKRRSAEQEAERVAAVVAKANGPSPTVEMKMDEAASAERRQVGKNGVGTVEGRVLDAVLYRGGSIKEIAKRLEIPSEDVALAIRKLDREGLIRSRVEANQLVWGRR